MNLCLLLLFATPIYAQIDDPAERAAFEALLEETSNYVVAEGEGVVDLNANDEEEDFTSNMELADENREEPWYKEHYEQLTKGLQDVATLPTYNSFLILINNNSFPIAVNRKGDPTVAGGIYGQGRFILLSRVEFMYRDFKTSMTPFIANAAAWLSNGKAPVVATHDSKNLLGYSDTQHNVQPLELSGKPEINLYKVNGWNSFSAEEIEAVHTFVKLGGGLIIGAQAWSFGGPKEALPVRYPANKITAKLGAVISGFDWQRQNSPVEPMPRIESSLYYALKNSTSKLSQRIIEREFNLAINKYTIDNPAFKALVSLVEDAYKALDKDDRTAFSKGATKYLPLLSRREDFDWSIVKKAKDVSTFPYDVPSGAERVEKTVEIYGDSTGYSPQFIYSSARDHLMLSTGIYCVAGSTVEISFPSNVVDKVRVSIGSHMDTLYHRENPKRSPGISVTYDVYKETQTFGNPWGGLVYLRVPSVSELGKFQITISNGVNAPHYIHGQTTNKEWNSTIRHYPAPWTEIEIPHQIILTIESSAIRDLEDIEKVGQFWAKLMLEVNNFAGFPNGTRTRTERVVLDIQISHGYLHSGYPIGGPISLSSRFVDVEGIEEKGSWGIFHELGHNHQYSSYTIGRTTETGCNLWSIVLSVELCGLRYAHSGLKHTDERLKKFAADGRPASSWSVWLALDTYSLLGDEYGWETYTAMFEKYYDTDPINGDDKKLDTWARWYSILVGKDLCDYFDWFRFPLTEETKTVCSSLPKPEKDLLAKYKTE